MAHFKDISGYETETLKVLRRLGSDKFRRPLFEILCKKCNKTFTTRRDRFKSGCRKCADVRRNIIDNNLIGSTKNNLHVDSYAYLKGGYSFFNCTCLICGDKCVKMGHGIRNGNTKSCSATCTNTHDWVGDKNAKREVIRWTGKLSKHNRRIWECHCLLCNKVYKTTSKALSRGHFHECNRRSVSSMRCKSNNDWFQMKNSMYWANEENRKAQSERKKQYWRNQYTRNNIE